MNKVFQSLIWPAAAGSIGWSFFTVITEEVITKAEWSKHSVWARLIVLLSIAVYLAADWRNTESVFNRLKSTNWIADSFLVVPIVIFALATEKDHSWAQYALMCAFVVAIVFSLVGAWEPTEKDNRNKDNTHTRIIRRTRGFLVLINTLGLIIVFAGSFASPELSTWAPAVGMTLTVGLYLWFLRAQKKGTGYFV